MHSLISLKVAREGKPQSLDRDQGRDRAALPNMAWFEGSHP